MIAFDIISQLFFFFDNDDCQLHFREFLDLLEMTVLIDFNWFCNLAISCVAFLRTIFIRISVPISTRTSRNGLIKT